MARKRKFPKQPKASASKQVWERWEARCKEVAKYNKEIEERPAKIRAIKERVRKLK